MSDSAFSKTFNNVIRRPELASLVGAIVIFILFVAVAPPFRSIDAFSTVLYASSTMGIVALAVGLLMIGDEFDLSSGVAVTSTALIATMLNYNLHLNSWVGVFISLASALTIGALNGVLVTRTGIPSFLITLSVFLMLQGLNLAVTKFVTGRVATPIISDMQGFPSAQKVFSSTLHIGPMDLRVTVLWLAPPSTVFHNAGGTGKIWQININFRDIKAIFSDSLSLCQASRCRIVGCVNKLRLKKRC